MIRKVLAGCNKLDPDRELRRYVVGVSGGADSMALLHCLTELSGALGVELTAVHVNHMARGTESEGDAAFVRRSCRELGVRCVVKRVNVKARARRRKLSFEMAARDARYECFLTEARLGRLPAAILTAHTLDDQAETVLLKLARGAGIRGLAGIPARSEVEGTAVLRPMLEINRREVVAFLRRRGLEWREDSSNASPAYLRNRVRRQVLPLIEAELNPNARSILARTAELLREDDALLETLTNEALAACAVSPNELSIAELRQEHRAIVRRVLMRWLSRNGVADKDLDLGLIAAVEKLIVSRKANASMKITGGMHILREYDRLCAGKTEKLPVLHFSCRLKPPGRELLGPLGLVFEAIEGKGALKERGRPGKYPLRATISKKAVGRKSLVVRSWKAGDRIKPMGMKGSKKIKDVLINLKVPVSVRSRVAVVECAGEIVWLPGYRVARGWEVGPGQSCIALSFKEV